MEMGTDLRGWIDDPDGLPDFVSTGVDSYWENESKSFRAAALEHVRQMPMVSWKNLMDGLLQFNSTAFIGDIHGDVLALWGTEDDIFLESRPGSGQSRSYRMQREVCGCRRSQS